MFALAAGLLVLAALPLTSSGANGPSSNPLGGLTDTLNRTLDQVTRALGLAPTVSKPTVSKPAVAKPTPTPTPTPAPRAIAVKQAEDPKTQPPIHGTNPHGQGGVAVVDLTPSADRPAAYDPNGGNEEIVVGRARGERRDDLSYHGHITIAALLGNEIVGVDTNPGESKKGPLDALQQGLLTPLCDGSGNQVCVTAVQADSETTATGSTNKFTAARATLGGASGIDAGLVESNGNISDDGNCQTAHGDSSVANAKVGGAAVADLTQSTTDSKACKDGTKTQTNTSKVIGLGGVGVPLPAPGCADGTPDTATGIPPLAPIICNADDTNTTQAAQPYGTREALSVFALDVGGTPLAKAVTAPSESRAVQPPPQCSDKRDNDGDGVIDAADPGCLSGPGGTYNPSDDDETNPPATTARPQCSDTVDNDGDGVADAADPGCLSGPGGAYNPNDNDETNPGGGGTAPGGGGGDEDDDAECADGRDNDGDGRIDRNDPGCLSGPGGRYNPNDDDESDGGPAQCADGRDNDGDGRIDRNDPGCLSGPGGSYNPNDDDESDGGLGGRPECSDGIDNDGDGEIDYPDDAGCSSPSDDSEGSARRSAGFLPRTGTDILTIALVGLLLVAAGGGLRRLKERT